MASLGLACIVKNEEQVLSRLLDSVKSLVDQIVIVDTGSTDKTVEIAKSYGAEVYHFEWVDDFAAARNESFQHITTDYVLWLDADDVVYPEDAAKIKELMEDPQAEQYLITYHYAHNEYGDPIISFLRERIIKRDLNLKWEDPIHEYLPLLPSCKERSDISIHHFKTKENSANTAKRNIRLLKMALEKNPTKARLQFYYAKELYDDGQFENVEKEFLKYLDMPGGWEINRAETYRKLAEFYINKREYEKALDAVDNALKIEKKKADLFCLKGAIYLNQQDYLQAIEWYEKAIYSTELNNWGFNQMDYHTWVPHLQLCLAYYHSGNKKKAKYHNDRALKYRPEDERILSNQKMLEEELNQMNNIIKEKTRETVIFYVPYGKSGGIKRIVNTAKKLIEKEIPVKIFFKLWGDYVTNPPTAAPFDTQVPFEFITNIKNEQTKKAKYVIACEWYLIPEIYQLSSEVIKIYYCLGNPYKIWPNQKEEIEKAFSLPNIYKLTSSRNLQTLLKGAEQTRYVERIPSAIDLEQFTISDVKIFKSLGLIYNPSEIKNCEIALKAFKQLKEKDPEFTFYIIGFDDLPTEYQNIFKIYKDLSTEQVAQIMRETQAWVLPSLTEGYSTIMLEAMAAGNVLICSDISDFELVIDEFSGIRFPSDNIDLLTRKISRLFTNPEKIDRIATQAYQIIHQEAKWSTFLEQFIRFLEKTESLHELARKKIKVGWICPHNKEFGPIRLRAHNIDRFLRSVGIESFFIMPLKSENLKDCDVYIASHCYDLELYKKVRELGKPLILDICEDLFNLEEDFKKAVEHADYVTCCSEKLAQITQEYNRSTFIVEDAIEIPTNLSYNLSDKKEKLVFGWMGYGNNFEWAKEVKKYINEAGHELLTIHEQDKELGDTNIKWSPEYHQVLLEKADVLIIPSNNIEQPAKSNNKLVTYLTLGKPVIADLRPSHVEVFEKTHGFFMVRTAEEWKEIIEKVEDPILRKNVAMIGKLRLKDQYIEEIGLKWASILKDLTKDKKIPKDSPKKKNLNVGCGIFKLPDFINLDINPKYNPDVIGDATDLHQFENDSIQFVFSSHTLEHLTLLQVKKALAEIYRVLIPGGHVDIILPDSKRVAQYYLEGKCDLQTFENWALAGGDHKILFTEQRILDLLQEAGFENVAPFDLNNYPWVIVPDVNNPKPEPYHCSARAFKPASIQKKTSNPVTEKRADIIIPTVAGNEKYLKECIKSIQKNTKFPHDITVVQSGSNKKVDLEVTNYFAFNRKLNFAKAVNYAIEKTSNSYVVLLNDDTIVSENWLTELQKGLSPTCKIVNPYSNCDQGWMHTDQLKTKNLDLIPKMKLKDIIQHVEEIYQFKSLRNEIKKVDWVAFYATLFDREVFNKVGLLNDKYESGGEDIDFCYRAQKMGFEISYNFNSFVFHFGAITRGDQIEELDQHNYQVAKKRYQGKSITFYAGPAWERWTPKNIDLGGIGGSETMLARVAEEFAKRGFTVKVFNDCQDEAGFYRGVQYLHHTEFEKYSQSEEMDIFVSSRVPWIFGLPIKSKYNVIWVHDIWLGDQNINIYPEKVNKYFVLSPWHQQFFCDHHKLDKSKTHITKNGIDLLRFENLPEKENNRLIYSSSPDRGLDVLLTCFPRIRKEIPDCTLHVFYGFENWEKSILQSGNKQQKQWMESIKNLMKQEGVIYHGRVGQQKLAEEFGKSSLWAQPTTFEETFCCLPGTKINTKNGKVNIEEIKKEIEVQTHKNQFRKVTETLVREVDEEILNINIKYLKNPLKITKEHPLFAVKRKDWKCVRRSHSVCRKNNSCCYKGEKSNCPKLKENLKPKWLPAKDLGKGDYLTYPIIQKREKPKKFKDYTTSNYDNINNQIYRKGTRANKIPNFKLTSEFFELCGWYISEGTYNLNTSTISFNLNINETHIADFIEIELTKLNLKCWKTLIPDENTLKISTSSRILGDFLVKNFGHLAKNKRIPHWVKDLDDTYLKSLLKGICQGDGCFDKSTNCFALNFASENLIDDLFDVFLKFKVVGACSVKTQKKIKRVEKKIIKINEHTTSYSIWVSVNQNIKLFKFLGYTFIENHRKNNSYLIDEQYVYLPIYKVKKENYKGNVYNLEVEGDNSYIANNIIAHNCITALEAMAAGTPIICSDYAGLQETAKGVAKYIFEGKFERGDNYKPKYQEEFIQAVIEMLKNKKLWKEYQLKGKEKVENFSYQAVADDWFNVFINEKILE